MGGGGKPLEGEISGGPFVWPDEYENEPVYVQLTVEGNPGEWPEFSVLGTTHRGYTGKISEGDDGDLEDVTVLYEDDTIGWRTTEAWIFAKQEFENDNEETEKIVLGPRDELEEDTSFDLYLHNPEQGESFQVAEVTYEGDPETRTLTSE